MSQQTHAAATHLPWQERFRKRRDGDAHDDPRQRRRAESLLPRKVGRSSVCLLTHRVKAAPRESALIPRDALNVTVCSDAFNGLLTAFPQWLSKVFMHHV